MRLEDVTPEWVRARIEARGLTQAQVAEEIGTTQDKLSKSLGGHRRFTTPELDALARLLCEPEPELSPETLEIARRIAALPAASRQVLAALVETLEQQQPPAPQEPE
jgi:transcriptional regulator with XRE-family HTH domain